MECSHKTMKPNVCGLCGTSHLVHNTSACPLCALLGMKGLYRAILPAYYCVYVCACAHAHLVTEWVDNVELVHKSIIKKRLVLSVFCWSIPGVGEILSDKHISLHTWLSITSAGLSDCDSWAVYNGFFDLRVCLLSLVWVSDFKVLCRAEVPQNLARVFYYSTTHNLVYLTLWGLRETEKKGLIFFKFDVYKNLIQVRWQFDLGHEIFVIWY